MSISREPDYLDSSTDSVTVPGVATAAKQDTLLTELQLKADLTDTQPVSAASLPLPSGAATAAKQLADNHQVAVSNFPATQPVSAASLPLPSGAATSANQQTNALTDTQLRATPVPVSGTVAVTGAGDASASNQTSGAQKSQLVDAGGEAATVTGGKLDVNAAIDTTGLALAANQQTDALTNTQLRATPVPVDTELPAAAALSDATANPTTPMIGSAMMVWDVVAWRRWFAALSADDLGDVFAPFVNSYSMVWNGTTWVKNRDAVYTTRIDEASGTVTYIGDATIGSATSGASWRVKKIDTSSGTSITFADGNGSFDNIWDNRASLSYS